MPAHSGAFVSLESTLLFFLLVESLRLVSSYMIDGVNTLFIKLISLGGYAMALSICASSCDVDGGIIARYPARITRFPWLGWPHLM